MSFDRVCAKCNAQAYIKSKYMKTPIPFGEIKYDSNILVCPNCGEEEPLETPDSILSEAIKDAQWGSIFKMWSYLSGQDPEDTGLTITQSQFEKAFSLPPRTIRYWLDGKFDEASLALLRVVTTYPWLIDVAHFSFNPDVADSALLQAQEKKMVFYQLKKDEYDLPESNSKTIIKDLPTDVFPDCINYRYVKVYVAPDDTCWASNTLAQVWCREQNIKNTIGLEYGLLPVNDEVNMVVIRVKNNKQISDFKCSLEISEKEKIRQLALEKLSPEEREALGI